MKVNNIINTIGVCLYIVGLSIGYKYANYFGIVFMMIFIINYIKNKSLRIGDKKIFITYAVILVLGIVWNFISPSKIGGIDNFITYNLSFIYIYLFLNLTKDSKSLNAQTWTFICGGILLALIVFAEIYIQVGTFGNKIERILFYKAKGISSSYYTSYYLGIANLFAVSKLFSRRQLLKSKNKVLKAGLLVLSILIMFEALLLTKMYIIIIIYVVCFIFMVINHIRKMRRWSVLIIIIAALYFINPTYFKNQSGDKVTKVLQANEYLKATPKKIIFGIGNEPKNFIQAESEIETKESSKSSLMLNFLQIERDSLGGMYFEIFMKSGSLLLGYLILFIFFIPQLFLRNNKKLKELKNKVEREKMFEINLAGMSGIIFVLLAGIYYSNWTSFRPTQEIFHFLTFILIFTKLEINKKIREEQNE